MNMKSLLINICLLLTIIVSCTDTEIMDSTFTLEVKGFVEEECYTFGEEQPLYLWASKNWADNQVSEVTYEVYPEALEAYNSSEGTSYKLLPESCYRIEQDSFSIDDETQYAKFRVMYSPEQIIAEGGSYNTVEYALPLRILVNGVPMEDRYGCVIVGFNVNKALISISNPRETSITIDNSVSQEIAMTFGVNYNNIEWVQLDFSINGELIDKYNQEHGTSYLPFPMEDLSYLTEEFELEREVDVDSALFYADMAHLDQTQEYLLAIRLDNVSSTRCKIDPENNTRYVIFSNPRIPQSYWDVKTSSNDGSHQAANLKDDDMNTYWLWNWSANTLPEQITYTLKDVNQLVTLERIELYPEESGSTWGAGKDITVYVTQDLISWRKVKSYEAAESNPNGFFIELDEPIECVGVRIDIENYHEGKNGIAYKEIYIQGKLSENPNPPTVTKLPQSSWTVTSSSKSSFAGDKPASAMNDDVIGASGFWVWDNNAKVLPEYITYTLSDQTQTATISMIEVIPFVGSNNWGGAKDITVEITTNGSTWTPVQEYQAQLGANGRANESGYTIQLDSPVECKAIRLKITSIYDNAGVAFSEIYMWGKLN